jgi:hypothetical protein
MEETEIEQHNEFQIDALIRHSFFWTVISLPLLRKSRHSLAFHHGHFNVRRHSGFSIARSKNSLPYALLSSSNCILA